jgi:hypothetical protein
MVIGGHGPPSNIACGSASLASVQGQPTVLHGGGGSSCNVGHCIAISLFGRVDRNRLLRDEDGAYRYRYSCVSMNSVVVIHPRCAGARKCRKPLRLPEGTTDELDSQSDRTHASRECDRAARAPSSIYQQDLSWKQFLHLSAPRVPKVAPVARDIHTRQYRAPTLAAAPRQPCL